MEALWAIVRDYSFSESSEGGDERRLSRGASLDWSERSPRTDASPGKMWVDSPTAEDPDSSEHARKLKIELRAAMMEAAETGMTSPEKSMSSRRGMSEKRQTAKKKKDEECVIL